MELFGAIPNASLATPLAGVPVQVGSGQVSRSDLGSSDRQEQTVTGFFGLLAPRTFFVLLDR